MLNKNQTENKSWELDERGAAKEVRKSKVQQGRAAVKS